MITIVMVVLIAMIMIIITLYCNDRNSEQNMSSAMVYEFVGAYADADRWGRRYRCVRTQTLSKAPKGNGIGATGSKNPRAY